MNIISNETGIKDGPQRWALASIREGSHLYPWHHDQTEGVGSGRSLRSILSTKSCVRIQSNHSECPSQWQQPNKISVGSMPQQLNHIMFLTQYPVRFLFFIIILDGSYVSTRRLSQDYLQCRKAWTSTGPYPTFLQGRYQVPKMHATTR